MRQESSDAAEDVGRMDSEKQMRNKLTSRWLDDVLRQAEGDFEDMVSTIEGQKRAMDEMHDGFLGTLGEALTGEDKGRAVDRSREVQTLLHGAGALPKIYQSAGSSIHAAFGNQNALESLQKNHAADVKTVKEVLRAGKRVCAGELEGIEQRARAKELSGREEVLEQATGIFGRPKKVEGEGLDKSLTNVEKGAKRMLKGVQCT